MASIRQSQFWLYIGILILCSSCKKEQIFTVRDLIENTDVYSGQLLKVQGCCKIGFEDAFLFPCDKNSDTWDDVISLDEYEFVVAYLPEKITPGFIVREREPSKEEAELEKRLNNLAKSSPTKVLLEGEFQSSERPEYGHNRLLKYRLIEHHVLRVEDRK